MEQEMTVEGRLREDLKEKLKRLNILQDQRILQETILKNLVREINGLEAVVSYIKGNLKGG
jgi:hypothetical protein